MLILDKAVICLFLHPNLHLDGQIVRFFHRERMRGNLPFNSYVKPHLHQYLGMDDYFLEENTSVL